ncbi:MAG: PAS domain S-box protein [Magnetococcales bacterium]|nr:PAS domain S-box protein [Magnetococcales bacterium]
MVGIGASAGGLEAFGNFFANMPIHSGMAFVVVQHLDAEHKSLLAKLLAQHTAMPVTQIQNGMEIQPNHVYVIPPDRDLSILNNRLLLVEPMQPRHQRLTIDHFFRSLAVDAKEHAIAIILSGTGSDGTQGIQAIKNAGGMIMVQDPASTKFDGMPLSAVQTGLVDYILPPQDMPPSLLGYARQKSKQPSLFREKNGKSIMHGDIKKQLQTLLALLHGKVGHDFSQYKENVILRRIQKRMAINHINTLEQYVKHLQLDQDEAGILFQEMMIGVSSFFRDTEVFEWLQNNVIPDLLEHHLHNQPIRIWVPGCATGEEAYSIAILLQEQMETLHLNLEIQIFATDLDSRAIEVARRGVYSDGIAKQISNERLNRYFTKNNSNFHINKRIRDMLLFAEQNVIKDPPFSHLDLISCRNLLIYFDAPLQNHVLSVFHYALKSKGYLLLGASETTSACPSMFENINRTCKLYRRKEITVERTSRKELCLTLPPLDLLHNVPCRSPGKNPDAVIKQAVEHFLLDTHAPACILVNDAYEPLYIHGRTGKYLEASAGKVNWNLMKMAKAELRPDLTLAMRKARSEQRTVRHEGLHVNVHGGLQEINLTVQPFSTPAALQGCFAVIFQDIGPIRPEQTKHSHPDTNDKEQHIAELEKNLHSTREYLQTTIEAFESANEELKATNGELQLANEELQSITEELETSREEGQTINEELSTLNSEYQAKITELSKANNDMANYMASTDVGAVFLDLELKIRLFTPKVDTLIRLIKSDIGRPITHLASSLVDDTILFNMAKKILKDLIPSEEEIQTKDGQWYFMRMKPYRTTENVIDGVVITFVDNSKQKKADRMDRLAIVVRDANDAIMVQTFDGRITTWNPAAERLYGYSEQEALGMNISVLCPEGEQSEIIRLASRIAAGEVVAPFKTQRLTRDGKIIKIMINATALCDVDGHPYAMATTEQRCHSSMLMPCPGNGNGSE